MRLTGIAIFVSLWVPATVLADPALTVAPTVMRAAPSVRARPVQEVPANAQVDLNSCSGSWCYSSWRNVFGYLPVNSIEVLPYATAPPAVVVPAPPVIAPPVVVAPWGPGYGYRYGYGYGWRRW